MGQVFELENKYLKISILKKGAQLCNFINKLTHEEILWNGNPDFWAKHSPILFPNIGKLLNETYNFNNSNYQLPKHGFVKDLDWELFDSNENQLTLKTQSSTSTLQIFPFNFQLFVSFILLDNGLKVQHEIKNIGENNLHFSLGAHPAFTLPFVENTKLTDYFIEFEHNETCHEINLSTDGFLKESKNLLLNNQNTIELSEELFYQDTVIIPDLISRKLSVKLKNQSNKKMVFSWENFPVLAIWKPKNAPFLCLEPWQGLPDYELHNGNWENKKGNACLLPNTSKIYSWQVEI